MVEFKREERYIVLKISDIISIPYFGEKFLNRARDLMETIAWFREKSGKKPLHCVVVESDWPEYEPTWKAIEERMTK